MLSPVSPSATGNTLRSLTSSRRDSSAASPASMRARKRTIDGSDDSGPSSGRSEPSTSVAALDHRSGAHLPGFDDLAGLQAARAHVHTPRGAAIVDTDALQVGIKAAAGRDHRVAAVVAERRSLGAHMTDLGHRRASIDRARPNALCDRAPTILSLTDASAPPQMGSDPS